MPVECVPSNLESDIRFVVCGQGFLLFCQRMTQHQRAQLRVAVQDALRNHHHDHDCGSSPHSGFLVEFAVPTLTPVYA